VVGPALKAELRWNTDVRPGALRPRADGDIQSQDPVAGAGSDAAFGKMAVADWVVMVPVYRDRHGGVAGMKPPARSLIRVLIDGCCHRGWPDHQR